MPLIGLSPFLHSHRIRTWDIVRFTRVNALNRALSISTLYWRNDVDDITVCVSMPLIGLSPFLREGLENEN